MMLRSIGKAVFHLFTGNRAFYHRRIREIAAPLRNKTILELGSGKSVGGKYVYSAIHLFPPSNNFIQSDINPEFGHQIVDATKLTESDRYDLILCLNVLEHIYRFQFAVDNMHHALKSQGKLLVAVPFLFPLHDGPADYWRFTEYSLHEIFSDFQKVEITPHRFRLFPTGYFIVAEK